MRLNRFNFLKFPKLQPPPGVAPPAPPAPAVTSPPGPRIIFTKSRFPFPTFTRIALRLHNLHRLVYSGSRNPFSPYAHRITSCFVLALFPIFLSFSGCAHTPILRYTKTLQAGDGATSSVEVTCRTTNADCVRAVALARRLMPGPGLTALGADKPKISPLEKP